MNFENTLLVTHAQCLDGSTSCLVFLAAGGKRENVYFSSPNHESVDKIVKELLETGRNIIVADASISLKLAEKLDKKYAPIVILDHHKSAIPLNKFGWCEIDVDNTRAGGKMLYDYFIDMKDSTITDKISPYEWLVDAADDYDRWLHMNPLSKTLVALHEALGQELFIDRFSKNSSRVLAEKEKFLIEIGEYKKRKYIDEKKKEVTLIDKEISGHNVRIALLEAGSYQSLLGNEICQDPSIGADIAVMVNYKSVSLRKNPTCPIDLSDVAKYNAGGGHSAAAGVGVANLLKKRFIDVVFDKIKWEDE